MAMVRWLKANPAGVIELVCFARWAAWSWSCIAANVAAIGERQAIGDCGAARQRSRAAAKVCDIGGDCAL